MPTFTSDMAGFVRAMGRFSQLLPNAADDDVARLTLIGLSRVKLAAAGRPGPRRVTGDYTRTMNAQVSRGANGVEGTIGTNAVQAMRLEFGFVGEDSLGRSYRQPPFPHWRPTFEFMSVQVGGMLPRAIEKAVERSFGA